MSYTLQPALLRTPDDGIFMVCEVGRIWGRAVFRSASEVYVKKIRMDSIDYRSMSFAYPKGMAEASRRMANPELGVAVVTEEAKELLAQVETFFA